jgi:hypothetical protein
MKKIVIAHRKLPMAKGLEVMINEETQYIPLVTTFKDLHRVVQENLADVALVIISEGRTAKDFGGIAAAEVILECYQRPVLMLTDGDEQLLKRIAKMHNVQIPWIADEEINVQGLITAIDLAIGQYQAYRKQ